MLEETAAPGEVARPDLTEERKSRIARPVANWRNFLVSPALAIFLFFVSLYFLTGTYFTKGVSDGEVMAQTAVALAEHHTVQLPANPGLPQIVPGKDGHYFSKYGLGQPLLAAGLYSMGRFFSRITMPAVNASIIGHFFIMLLPLLATALTVWLVYLWGKMFYGSIKIGLGLALLYGLGTGAWPYSKIFFSEALFTLCTFAAAFVLWLAQRAVSPFWRYSWIALAGFLLSYSLMTKVSGVVILPAYLLYLYYPEVKAWTTLLYSRLTSGSKRNLSGKTSGRLQPASINDQIQNSKSEIQNLPFILRGLAFGLGMLPGIIVILLHNYIRFGSPFNNGYDGEGFTTPLWKGLSGLLFSPGKSIFVYSPVLLALPFAVSGFWRKARPEAILFGLISLITLLYYSVWWAWEGGWSWGPRFLVPLLPFLIFPLGVVLQKSRSWVVGLFGVLLPLGVIVQMLGVAVDANLYMAAIANNPNLAPDVYIWKLDASPIFDHWTRLWQPPYNLIRSLTLEQLGFRPVIGHAITWAMLALFGLSGIWLCFCYLKASKTAKK